MDFWVMGLRGGGSGLKWSAPTSASSEAMRVSLGDGSSMGASSRSTHTHSRCSSAGGTAWHRSSAPALAHYHSPSRTGFVQWRGDSPGRVPRRAQKHVTRRQECGWQACGPAWPAPRSATWRWNERMGQPPAGQSKSGSRALCQGGVAASEAAGRRGMHPLS